MQNNKILAHLVPITEQGSDIPISTKGRIPSKIIPDGGNREPITFIHEWNKSGCKASGAHMTTYDPATGKHFYVLNGVKVITD